MSKVDFLEKILKSMLLSVSFMNKSSISLQQSMETKCFDYRFV